MADPNWRKSTAQMPLFAAGASVSMRREAVALLLPAAAAYFEWRPQPKSCGKSIDTGDTQATSFIKTLRDSLLAYLLASPKSTAESGTGSPLASFQQTA